MKTLRLPMVLLPMLFVLGCGDSAGRVSVTGKVTFGGGDWPKAGTIFFAPIEAAEGFSRVPGTGEFQTDGSFTVKSTGEGMGLPPGKYQLNIECWEVPPNMEGKPTKTYLPDGYRGPEIIVEAGIKEKVVEFDVPAR